MTNCVIIVNLYSCR